MCGCGASCETLAGMWKKALKATVPLSFRRAVTGRPTVVLWRCPKLVSAHEHIFNNFTKMIQNDLNLIDLGGAKHPAKVKQRFRVDNAIHSARQSKVHNAGDFE